MSSKLQQERLRYIPRIPKILEQVDSAKLAVRATLKKSPIAKEIAVLFPKTHSQEPYDIIKGSKQERLPLRVGVVLSGGQAPGGHNVIAGLFDALRKLNSKSTLIGFLNGPSGIVANQSIGITEELLAAYRNQGGFDIIGSGRTKIETPEQFEAAMKTAIANRLDGLVVIGGDDSNTNAALLAEYFAANGCSTHVVGVPKTIDGDLKTAEIEASFGFDTACKTYAATIGSLMRDALSAKKYYYFIKLMGRSASHIALECALQTHPNATLISEEVAAQKKTLAAIVKDLCDLIVARSAKGKDYGVFLIPEGVIEFIPEVKTLIQELNTLLASGKPHQETLDYLADSDKKISYATDLLSSTSRECFLNLPKDIQAQLLIGRDAHGNVQVSKIETERMLAEMVKNELKARAAKGLYKGKFDPQTYFCGYEGRATLPSNFDSNYCYALGVAAAVLVDGNASGYICFVKNLSGPIDQWQAGGLPIIRLMTIEKRHGHDRPVIEKALVNLNGKPFLAFKAQSEKWALDDDYTNPGPIQFFGPADISDAPTITLILE